MSGIEVAYVLLRFPQLTETFVAEEIHHVQSLGVKVRLFSLLAPRQELVHPVSAELLPQVCYVPGLHAPSLWGAQIHILLQDPVRYCRLLWHLLSQPSPHRSFRPKRLVTFLKAVWAARELQKTPVQLVHSHFAWLSAAAGAIVSQLLDLPLTVTTHAFDIYSIQNDLLALTTQLADRVVTISEYNKQAMLEVVPNLEADQIEVVHCGVSLEKFQATTRPSNVQTFQITAVGSLILKKGHEYLIRACGELGKNGIDYRCVVVGDGALKQPLQALISQLGLDERIVLKGPQSQTWVRDRLQETDLFALPCVVEKNGERDGIPVVMMEALAMEVPVVSTSVSGIPELIRHEETGLLVPERDASALAAAIARLAQDKGLRCMLATNGRALVEREYDIWKNARRLVELFQQVIEKRVG
jgi:glycosyltransferase involved in cell wall biosynthesis